MPELSELGLLVSQALTTKKIFEAVEQIQQDHPLSSPLPKRLSNNKSILIQRIFKEGTYWQTRLVELAQQERVIQQTREEARRARVAERKRKSRRSTRSAKDEAHSDDESSPPDLRFLDCPSWEKTVSCFQKFYDATSNDALYKLVCAVCARSLNKRKARIKTLPLGDLPNSWRLRPSAQHKSQTLVGGYLLEAAGCIETENGRLINVCRQCLRDLKKPNVSTPPKFSLANGLCVGNIPQELQHLTLTEQLLLARVYPRVFVMKLYPKSTARHGLDDDQLQGALRGNVTSFALNSDAIADMVSGNLMPQPPAVLASVLSVTFIGRGKVPNPAALRLFQVRRHKVAAALEWLRIHNPKYYGDIKIDRSRLDALPENGVPPEVLINMRQETDTEVLNTENDGYVPEYDQEDINLADSDRVPLSNPDEDDDTTEPDVVPLQHLGVMDNDLTTISTSEILASGLLNLGHQHGEGGYAVRHGGPVNTFGQPPVGAPAPDPNRPNYWERAFPFLYPYGTGGIEGDRPVPLTFIEHVRWSLQYHDRRFRLHPTFIFVAFGIHQRRQVLASARIQMRRRNFTRIAHILSTISPEDLRIAAEEEDCGQKPSNPAIDVLKRYVNATCSRVVGSDAARYQLRSQIWSTSVALNPPTLWITINPDDLHDPIAQIFAGEEINMDDFANTAGPDKNQRSRNIARDPYAAAEFFNFLVTTILEELLGIRVTNSQVHSSGGVLGDIRAYFGVVECQGRGTLHLHMLVWLKDVPPPNRLKDLLHTPEFKAKVVAYLQANVRAFTPQLATDSHLKVVSPDPEVCYSRFPDPATPEPVFRQALNDLETRVVRTKQMHSCSFGKCLRLTKHGRLSCKRRAPFELCPIDSVDDDGTYHIKRTLGYLNNYCPAITLTAKCNNDIKLLLHGTGTNNITFYVTGYIAKKQGKSYNVSGLLSKHLIFHFGSDDYANDLRERQRLLLVRAVNVLNREQEVPAPLAVSHLMGWGDVYRSHHYAPIFWGSFIGELYDQDPSLKRTPTFRGHNTVTLDEGQIPLNETGQDNSQEADTNSHDEAIVLGFNQHGQLHFRSQVEDYMHRGDALETCNVLDFIVGTYEQKGRPTQQSGANPGPSACTRTGVNSTIEIGSEGESTEQSASEVDCDRQDVGQQRGHSSAQKRKAGRPPHIRVPYQSAHPSHSTCVRVVRGQNHNTLPNFIGPRIPRQNDPDQVEFYSASVLTLLKPWRQITDLKQHGQSWANALESFLLSSDSRIRDIVASFEHYYECKSVSEADQRDLQTVNEDNTGIGDGTHEDMDVELSGDQGDQLRVLTNAQITPEMIAQARIEALNERNPGYGREAVEIGRTSGVFAAPCTPLKTSATRGTNVDIERLATWQKILQRLLKTSESAGTTLQEDGAGDVTQIEDMVSTSLSVGGTNGAVLGLLTQHALDPAIVSQLFPEQLRAFNIVRCHLGQTLAAIHSGTPPPPQLRMLLVGEGGTGKSKVIQTITAEFERRSVSGLLLKSAFTGIAASLIQGKTTHQIGCISVNRRELSDEGRVKLAQIWKDIRYLIIDEYSMLSKTFFAQLSRHIQIGRMAHDAAAADMDFGGVNVLICGDGHQFPPVQGGAASALYRDPEPGDSPEAKLGRDIFKRFTTVVILRRQVRVTDEKWRTFLTSLRCGQVQPEQVDMLRGLTLTNPSCKPTDFGVEPWQNVSLVTPRHIVRNQWNEAAVARHCRKDGCQLFICPAKDTIRKRPLTRVEQYVAARADPGNKTGGLPHSVMLAIGMKVMVTLNVQTDLDIANGARGEIVDIVLSSDEPPFDSQAEVVTLQHLPTYILVKLARHTRAINLPGLEAGVVPIVPAAKGFRIIMDVQKGGKVVRSQRTVRRLQFPITPAYAFTDYRSQGQTIKSVIVDITSPPTGKRLTLFNIYVALSRSSGTDTIRILRDFNESILMQPLDEDLAAEDRRLEELDFATLTWYTERATEFEQ